VFPVQLEWVDYKPQALSEDVKVKVKELQRAGDPNTLLESHKKAYAEVLKQVVDVPTWDETKVETTLKAFNDAKESYIFTKESENVVRARKIELEKAISDIKQRNQQAEAAIEKLTKDLWVFQEQVRAKHLATSTIKAIRDAKPKIVRSLWDTAMTLTSEFLTEIRGEPSEVTFDDGFKVNGAPASSYSGSGKDVLGLALRVALTKAFVPSLDFLIVDEPFAKCSEARQQVALGFLASSGFDQIILVTHEEQSEAIADNLITI
jgi:DNA repair exonuclease SbcCD ATPase subunit